MKHYKQFQPLLISDFETSLWPHPLHHHNHYEIIIIEHGKGVHLINDNQIPYHSGSIFMLGPDEVHSFQIEDKTSFIFIKFTDEWIHQANSGSVYGLQQLEYLIKSRETHLNGFELNEADQKTVHAIVPLIRSLKEDTPFNKQLIWLQVLTLATLLQRNMSELKADSHRTRDMQAVFCYLHKHIYTPEKLKAAVMAAHFNTTADYIGPYFKRNAGITFREYISNYRKTLIQKRIQSGNYSLKQIADEFGLTDESHVSKILR